MANRMPLDLVIDANVLFSAMLAKSTTRQLLLSPRLELYAPEYLFEEFADHVQNDEEFKAKLSQNKEETALVLGRLKQAIQTVPLKAYTGQIRKTLPDCPDPADAPYLALASHLGLPLWSNDKRLKKQDRVVVLNTQEVLERLKKEANLA